MNQIESSLQPMQNQNKKSIRHGSHLWGSWFLFHHFRVYFALAYIDFIHSNDSNTYFGYISTPLVCLECLLGWFITTEGKISTFRDSGKSVARCSECDNEEQHNNKYYRSINDRTYPLNTGSKYSFRSKRIFRRWSGDRSIWMQSSRRVKPQDLYPRKAASNQLLLRFIRFSSDLSSIPFSIDFPVTVTPSNMSNSTRCFH